MIKRSRLFLIIVLFVSGCIGPEPVLEYNLARTALKAARNAEANRYASGYLHEAERLYRLAQRQHKNKEYEEAEKNFRESRRFAEKAENATRLKKFNSGEGI